MTDRRAVWAALVALVGADEARYLLEERAAILEHDAGYGRAEAEDRAWAMAARWVATGRTP